MHDSGMKEHKGKGTSTRDSKPLKNNRKISIYFIYAYGI